MAEQLTEQETLSDLERDIRDGKFKTVSDLERDIRDGKFKAASTTSKKD